VWTNTKHGASSRLNERYLVALLAASMMMAAPSGAQEKAALYYSGNSNAGALQLKGPSGSAIVHLGARTVGANTRGGLWLYPHGPGKRVAMTVEDNGGTLQLLDMNNPAAAKVDLRSDVDTSNTGVSFGSLRLRGTTYDEDVVYLGGAGGYILPKGQSGLLKLLVSNGGAGPRTRVQLGVDSMANGRNGRLQLWNTDGSVEAVTLSAKNGEQTTSALQLRGPTNTVRAQLRVLGSNPIGGVQDLVDCGQLHLKDKNGQGTLIDGCTGEKNAVMNHPRDPRLQIYYGALEGPEAGLYVRGTASLVGGQARVTLPEHFALVASNEGLTAHLTPRSPGSQGLAVVRLAKNTLEVAELGRGTGTYEFDYLVYGQRVGKEGYRVVRPRDEGPPEEPAEGSTESPQVANSGERGDDPPPTADRPGGPPAPRRP
jgi:hypothetical protein